MNMSATHDHARRAVDYDDGIECILLTLRDPVERLESAFRKDVLFHNGVHMQLDSAQRGTRTLPALVSALSNANSARLQACSDGASGRARPTTTRHHRS